MNSAIEEQLATNLYYDRTFDCEAAKILPGEYYFTNKPMLIVTVLGSCVAACLRDRVTGIGGMNHFMLPDGGGDPSNPLSA
jgi:chemotaxis protein CheD